MSQDATVLTFNQPLGLTELPDAVLVQRANAGCLESRKTLLQRHWPRLRHRVRRACGHGLFAEDLCQEACLKALVRLPGLRHPEAFGPWLQGFLAHEIHHCRRSCQKKVGTPRPPDGTTPIEGMNAVAENHDAHDFEIVWGFLSRHVFADGSRTGRMAVFMLEHYRRLEELPSVRTIAASLPCGRGTAERLRAAVLTTWRRDLTSLGLHPEPK